MRYRLLIIIIALFIPAAGAAQDSIFDIMDEKYIIDISELPASTNLQPEKSWQPSYDWVDERCRRKHNPYFVFGFLDIVGFKNMSKINGTFHIMGAPADSVIIQYETYACAMGYPRYKGGWNYKLETYQQDNQFVAKLTATAILYYYIEANKYYDNITKIFHDYEPLPLQYTQVLNPKVNITEYNNSVNPRTVIKLTADIPAFINYTYNGDHISNYKMIAHVEKTPKGVYFANVSAANIWTNGTGSLRQMNDKVIIPGTADPDYQNLTIQVSDIYKTENVSNFTIIRDTYKLERSFSGLYISVIMIFSIMAGTLYYTAKRALL